MGLDASCSWCNSPKPGKGNKQLCSGPPSADDCGTLPGKNKTQKLQYASWGDSVSKGIFGQLSGLLTDYESFHPSSNLGGGCGNVVRGKYCTDLWLHGADGDSASRKWDLITFNFGLHDMAVDDEHVSLNAYKRNLRNISSRLLTATASGRLYWLSSTPVPNVKLGPPRPQGDVALYNAAAKEVIDDLGIPIIDYIPLSSRSVAETSTTLHAQAFRRRTTYILRRRGIKQWRISYTLPSMTFLFEMLFISSFFFRCFQPESFFSVGCQCLGRPSYVEFQ